MPPTYQPIPAYARAGPGQTTGRGISGRFALDFDTRNGHSYREWLHASYLEIVERALNERHRDWSLRSWHQPGPSSLDMIRRGARGGFSASALSRQRGPRGSRGAVRPLCERDPRKLGVEPPPLGIAVAIGKVPYSPVWFGLHIVRQLRSTPVLGRVKRSDAQKLHLKWALRVGPSSQ